MYQLKALFASEAYDIMLVYVLHYSLIHSVINAYIHSLNNRKMHLQDMWTWIKNNFHPAQGALTQQW